MPHRGRTKSSSALDALTPGCFFLLAVAYKLAWTAISSLLSQFSRDYGPEVLLQLNIAYFLPSIPVLMLQTRYNEAFDRKVGGPARGAILRFLLGLGGLTMLTLYFPNLASSHSRLLAVTTAVGMSYGVAFGTSYQLASHFPPVNTVMLTTGFVSSGPIVLVLDLLFKRGPYYSPEGLQRLFTAVSWITFGGLLAACAGVVLNLKLLKPLGQEPMRIDLAGSGTRGSAVMKTGSTRKAGQGYATGPTLASRYRVDSGVNGSDGHHSTENGHHHHAVLIDAMEGGMQPGARHDQSGSSGGGARDHDSNSHSQHHDYSTGKQRKPDVPLLSLAWRISPAALSIFLSVGTSMLVFPFFTYMHTSGLFGERFVQVLFYVRLVGDIVGRVVPRDWQVRTVSKLLLWALVKTAMVPLLFACIFTPGLTGGDLGAALSVGVFWVLSGYVNTCSYLVAPTLVPPSSKARASGLMTVAFQSSCFLALLGAAAIQRLTASSGLTSGGAPAGSLH